MSKKKRRRTTAVEKRKATAVETLARPPSPLRFGAWTNIVWAAPYLAALVWWRDQVPDGLNNDVAEEALRGLYLVGKMKFEVITFALGNSAETLYLYVVGATAKMLGPTTLAVQAPSWAATIAAIWLLGRVIRRIDASIPTWVPLALAASSVWLLHYARSGLRAIAAPVFLLLFWLLLDRAERCEGNRRTALSSGAVLGLSLYAYTSCRVLPVIFVLYALIRLASPGPSTPLRTTPPRSWLVRCYAYIAAGAFLISIPNLVFLLRSPGDFLVRGSYVLRGSPGDMAVNALWTFLLPTSLFADVYRQIQGPAHFFDGVSASLTMAGINPIHPLVAAAFLVGLTAAWKARREPGALFLLVAWASATVVLGITGPSLTRMLILLPVYLALASLGIGAGLRRFPGLRPLFALSLLAVAIWHGYAYFTRLPASPVSSFYFGPVATPMGERAEQLASEGRRVVCVIFKDASVIRYLTHSRPGSVEVAEFYFRRLAVQEIPLKDFNPDVLLIEKHQGFAEFSKTFPPEWHRMTAGPFDEVHLRPTR